MTIVAQRNIFILDDGKRGHLNQSLAVAELIPQAQVSILPVRYRTLFARGLMNIACHTAWTHNLRKAYLKLCLKDFSLPKGLSLEGQKSKPTSVPPRTVLISTGAITEPINYLLSTDATINIVILKPIRSKKFDLIITPQHDGTLNMKNVFQTTLALSKLNSSQAQRAALNLKQKIQLPHVRFASVFVGGNSRFFSIDFSHLEQTLTELTQSPLFTLITISRRTPQALIEQIKRWRQKHQSATHLILEEGEDVVSGMVGLAECVFVTEDSVSMVSEILNCHKKPFVIPVKEVRTSRKFKKLKKILEDKKYIVRASDFRQFNNNFTTLNLKENLFEDEKNRIKNRLLEIL